MARDDELLFLAALILLACCPLPPFCPTAWSVQDAELLALSALLKELHTAGVKVLASQKVWPPRLLHRTPLSICHHRSRVPSRPVVNAALAFNAIGHWCNHSPVSTLLLLRAFTSLSRPPRGR